MRTTIVALILLCIAACRSAQGDYGSMAVAACRTAVEERLKAPRTAQFASAGDTQIETVRHGERYDVLAYVDAQNAFGALMRMRYRCEVQFTGGRDATPQIINLMFQ